MVCFICLYQRCWPCAELADAHVLVVVLSVFKFHREISREVSKLRNVEWLPDTVVSNHHPVNNPMAVTLRESMTTYAQVMKTAQNALGATHRRERHNGI